MSWESSAKGYRLINETSKRRLGGHHTVRTLMLTVDFGEMLIDGKSSSLPLFDTTRLHAEAAVEWALGNGDRSIFGGK